MSARLNEALIRERIKRKEETEKNRIFWDEVKKQKEKIEELFQEAINALTQWKSEEPIKSLLNADNSKVLVALHTSIAETKSELLKNIGTQHDRSIFTYCDSNEAKNLKNHLNAAENFALTLLSTIHTATDPHHNEERDLSSQLDQLHKVARGSFIPPKVKLIAKSMIPGIALIGGLSLLSGLTPILAGFIAFAGGPAGIALFAGLIVMGFVALTCCVYLHNNSSAKIKTRERDAKMDVTKKFKHCLNSMFAPKNKHRSVQENPSEPPLSDSDKKLSCVLSR